MHTEGKVNAKIKDEDNITKFIEKIPAENAIKKVSKPLFILVGKSGSGKSTVANKLAEQLGSKVVSAQTVLNKEVHLIDDEIHDRLCLHLYSGKEVATSKILEAMEAAPKKDSLKFSGIILDDIPSSSATIVEPSKPNTGERPVLKKIKKRVTKSASSSATYTQPDLTTTSTNVQSCNNTAPNTPTSEIASKFSSNTITEFSLIDRLTSPQCDRPASTRSRPGSRASKLETIPDFIPVVIQLNIEDSSLKRRRKAQKIDPLTGMIYSAQRIKATLEAQLASKNKFLNEEDENQEEAVENEEENDEMEEENEEDEESKIVDEEYLNFNVLDNMNEEENVDLKNKTKKKGKLNINELKKVKLSNKQNYEPISDEIFKRLLRRSEDFEENIDRELLYWSQSVEPYLKQLKVKSTRQKTSNYNFHYIEINGSQHPDVIIKDVMHRIDTLGLGLNLKTIFPKILVPLDVKGKSEEDIVKIYSTLDLEPDEPPRELGNWGKYCAVSFVNDKILVNASMTYVVAYAGFIHFFANQKALNQFMENPNKFLTCPTQIPSLKICILGGPFSGKSTQGTLLAKIYKLKYLNLDQILSKWDKNPDQTNLIATNQIYKRVRNRLRSGKTISAAMEVEIFKFVLNQMDEDEEFEESAVGESSWLLDGFPRTVDQAKALIESGLIPQYAITLKNDINELSVRDRADLFFSSTVSGEECREELGIKFSPDRVEVKTPKNLNSAIYPLDWCPENKISMFPFFDNLYNGFKEEYSEIVKLYEEREVKIMLVPAELAVHTVLSTLQTAIDPFLPKAVPLSAAKISQLPANVELGITKHYCPVSLRKRQVLTNGSPNYAVLYRTLIYYLVNEEARSAFCAEPHNFVTFSSYMQAPPLRIAVFGPSGSGKSEVCKNLSRHSGVPHVDFEILLKEHILNLSDAEKEEVEVSIRDTAAPPAHVINNLINLLFKGKPFDTSGFILEHFPRNKSEAELLLKQGFHVDAVVNLKVDAELLGNRIHLKTLKENAAKHLYLQDPSYDPEGELSALIDGIEKEENRVSETISAIESYSSIPVQEIDANRFLRPIISEIKHNLRIFIENRKSILSNARSVDFKTAEDLLKYGVKKFSKFRKYCPITIAKNRCLTRASLGYLPVIHGEFVYYLRTETERKEFLENTFNFIDNPPPEPHIQPSIFIVGPPKSGKTLAAERIARDFDITYLTIPIILQAILDGKEDSELYEALTTTLTNGFSVPDTLIIEAVYQITSRGICQSKGWILDGYPHTFEQAKALEELGVSPNNVIIFDVESGEQIKRTLMDFEQDIIENKQRLNAADVVSLRNENYLNEKKGICEFYTSKYDNCTMISKCCSKWAAANMAHNAIEKTILCKQNYWNLKYHGKAAPIFGVGLNNYHVQENISKYENYCLVTLLDSDELEKGSAGTECVAEYQNMFYRFKNKEAMNKFLACPTVYLSRPGLPELPCRMSASDIKLSFPASMELQGYCPVTLLNGPPGFQSLIHGNCNNVVEYKGKLYVMADEKKTEAFLRNPWKFENLTLPKKLPPNKVEITVANLPMVGYLEQTLAVILNDALKELGKFKPKYPFRSLQESAGFFIAVYLKAHNPKSSEWLKKNFKRKLNHFKNECELINYLSKTMEQRVYIPPVDREFGFDKKMEVFLSLKKTI